MTCDTCKNRNRAFDCPVLKYDADNHCFEECPEYELKQILSDHKNWLKSEVEE